MPLDPQVQVVLDLVKKANYPQFYELSPAEARALFDRTAPVLDVKPEPIHGRADRPIPRPAGSLTVRVFTPFLPDPAAPLPLLLFLHGGGWVIGSLDCYDAMCRVLAKRADCIVVSVDYRLAPEARFPAAPADCLAAYEWLLANAGSLGGDPGRIAIAGDSAGGNLAAVTAQAVARKGGPQPVLQVLIYPVTAGMLDAPSHLACAEGYLLTRRTMQWFYDHYAPAPADRRDPRLAPLLARELTGLPPSLVIVAEFDPLHDEGVAYAEALKAAGNRVILSDYAGMVHGFFSLSGVLDSGRQALAQTVAALRTAFGAG
ncbi:MAG: alpha/beta hydrolase [Alphaproteobacteria bacterium]|nr:alpha/beta hydrolase [Alphaproteobacteria bacterium]